MTAIDTPSTRVIGTPVLRKEDPRLLTGEARFTDDLVIPGALHLAVLRSPFAHARIRGIDASAAKALPGVVAVYTGNDVADLWAAPMPCAWPVTPDMKNPPHFPLAKDKACYVGDGVAVVLAHSDAEARDALDAIDVDYEPLEAVIDLEDALSDRVVIHDDAGTNVSYVWELNIDEDGAVQKAFDSATYTVKERYIQQRLIPMAMEPRAVAAVPQPFGGDMTLYSATQIPHILKIMVALTLGIPEHQMRVDRPERRRRLRLEAQRLRRGAPLRGPGPQARPARALGRGADREQPGHHPGPGPDPGHRAGRRRRRQAHRRPRRADRRHGRLPAAGHARHPAPGRVPVRRRVRPAGGLRLQVHVGVHHHDAHRRLPGRRPARGDLRHRAGHGRAGREDRRSTRSSCGPATSSAPSSTRTPR